MVILLFIVKLLFSNIGAVFWLAWSAFSRSKTAPLMLSCLALSIFFFQQSYILHDYNKKLQAEKAAILSQRLQQQHQEILFWEKQAQLLPSKTVWMTLNALYSAVADKDKAEHALQQALAIDPN